MPKKVNGWDLQMVQNLSQVFGHCIVGKDIGVRRSAVIALVDGQDSEGISERSAERMPIVKRTQKSVKDDKRLTVPVLLVMKDHYFVILPRHSSGILPRHSCRDEG